MHVVRNSGHNLASDNPEDLARVIIGDLEGTIKHKFDVKLELYYLEQQDEEHSELDKMVIHPYNDGE